MTQTAADLARRIEAANDVGEAAMVAGQALSQPGLLAHWLSPMLARLADDPHYRPPLSVKQDGGSLRVLLLEHRAVTLSATVIASDAPNRAAQTVTLTGQMHVTAYLRADGAAITPWRRHGDQVVASNPITLRDGMVCQCDGRNEAHLLVPSGRQMLFVTAAIHAGADPLVREYGCADGRLLRTGTTDTDASRRQLLLSALRVIGDPRASEAFKAASRHRAFFLRWEAMREWLGHDAIDALPRLEEMARHDPEPAIRNAANAMAATVRAQIEPVPCPA